MATRWAGLTFVPLFAVGVAASVAGGGPPGAVLWAGSRHAWQRKLAGVQTPHRVSRWASWVDAEAGTAGVAFAPGRDGDYAHPEVRLASHPGLARGPAIVVELSGRDLAQVDAATGHPAALLVLRQRVALGGPVGGSMALQGFNVTSACVLAHQPRGEPCDSQGAWLTGFDLKVDCEGPGALECDVEVTLERAENADSAAHPHLAKKFNWALDWAVEVFLARVGPAEGSGVSLREAVLPQLRPAPKALHEPIAPFSLSVLVPSSPPPQQALLAIRGLGFSLTRGFGADPKLPLGRYFEELSFHCAAAGPPQDSSLTVDCIVGLDAPHTTYTAGVEARVDAVVLLLDGPGIPPPKKRTVAGEVCVSGDPGVGKLVFSCKRQGLLERTDDVVDLWQDLPERTGDMVWL